MTGFRPNATLDTCSEEGPTTLNGRASSTVPDPGPRRLRWVVVGVLVSSTSLSFLDRQLLSALAPAIKQQFGLSNEGYGYLLGVFSLAYAVCAPLSGLVIDAVGLTLGMAAVVALWSAAGIATGISGSLGSLLACRTALGAAESGGIPATAKGFALYLEPGERAMGTALNQTGITVGMMGAPLLVGLVGAAWGWRAPFVCAGVLGFAWLPLWLLTGRHGAVAGGAHSGGTTAGLARDWRLWALAGANILMMPVYSLWTNWTTVFLVSERGLTMEVANSRLAWIPPVFASLGGLWGGWYSMRRAGAGDPLYAARLRACVLSGGILAATAGVPWVPGAGMATAAVCLSFFMAVAMSANIYAMPLDLFGARHAAFAVSWLTTSYGLMQTIVSPVFGRLIDTHGFAPVCVACGVLPLGALAVLVVVGRSSTRADSSASG